MRGRLRAWLGPTVFVVSAYIGVTHVTEFNFKNISEYWYIGPTFGAVVLLWHVTSLRDLFSLRSAAFLLGSLLIPGLAISLVITASPSLSPILGDHLVSWIWEVAIFAFVGTALLAPTHAIFLKVPLGRAMAAIPRIYLTWFAMFASMVTLDAEWQLNLHKTMLFIPLLHPVYAWQVSYLLFMFGRMPTSRRISQAVRVLFILICSLGIVWHGVLAYKAYRYATFEYPIILVGKDRKAFQAVFESIKEGETAVSDQWRWQVKGIRPLQGVFLVSLGYQRSDGKEVGWWWEVNTHTKEANPQLWDKNLELKYGLLASKGIVRSGPGLLRREVAVVEVVRADSSALTIRTKSESGLEGSIVVPRSARIVKEGEDVELLAEDFSPGTRIRVTYFYHPTSQRRTAIKIEFLSDDKD